MYIIHDCREGGPAVVTAGNFLVTEGTHQTRVAAFADEEDAWAFVRGGPSLVFGYAEVEAGTRESVLLSREAELNFHLRRALILGNPVLAVVRTNDNRIKIRHLGYTGRCGPDCLECQAGFGAVRIFGLTLVLGGDFDVAEAPLAFQATPHARLYITGKVLPWTGERWDLRPVVSAPKLEVL